MIAKYKSAVDPNPINRARFHTEFRVTSDAFFETLDKDTKWDIIFIDGLHESEQVIRDIKNSLEHLSGGGAIVCHDMNPVTKKAQLRTPNDRTWNGDCWKAWMYFRRFAGFTMYVVNTDFGCGIIQRGNQAPIIVFNPIYKGLKKNRKKWLN